ncbi:MAG: hypothetical protein AAB619_01875, partial [Patescibacteria group bacterium]
PTTPPPSAPPVRRPVRQSFSVGGSSNVGGLARRGPADKGGPVRRSFSAGGSFNVGGLARRSPADEGGPVRQSLGVGGPVRRWPWEILAGLGIVVMAVIVTLVTRPRPPAASVSGQPLTRLAGVPDSYSDFAGKIVSLDGTRLTVNFRGWGADGRLFDKIYLVQVDPATELQILDTVNGERQKRPLKLADLKPDDTVLVSGDGNLATQSSFTATKLYLYQ